MSGVVERFPLAVPVDPARPAAEARASSRGGAMSVGSFAAIVGSAAVSFLGATLPAAAQAESPTGQGGTSLTLPQTTRPRIEIYPRPLVYRHCTDWYELQHRPSGTVLYPHMRCWWVRG
jgi:hypothetical protein